MSNFDRFIAENPNHPKVVQLIKLANRPLSLNGKLGTVIGEVMRLADEVYA